MHGPWPAEPSQREGAGTEPWHFMPYPCEAAALRSLGFTDHAVTAILLPQTLVRFTNQ